MDITLFLTIPEAAHLLRIAPQTIRNHIFKGIFPIPTTLLCGRRLLRRADVEAYVRGETIPAHPQSSPPSSVSKRGRPRKRAPESHGSAS